jgi:hypothetical protein
VPGAVAAWVAHIGLAAVQVLAWWGLGSLLAARLSTGVRAVDVLNRVGLGAVGFALLTFALGLADLLYAAPIWIATLAAAAFGAIALRQELPGLAWPRSLPRAHVAALAFLGAIVALALVAVAAPVNGFDALAYHVSVPVLYERDHGISELAWSWHSYQPLTVEMLIADGLLLWNPVQGAFAPLALVLLGTAAVIVGGRLVGGTGLGLLAGAIYLGQPLVAWESTAALIDGGLACAIALSALNLLVWVRSASRAALVASGLFLGAGAGMKYIGLYAAIAFGVAALLVAGRRARPAAIATLAVPALLVAAPWYLKNAIWTGNPVFPFFGGVEESARAFVDGATREYGFGRSVSDALLLPVRLAFDSDAFDGSAWLSPLLLFFPLLALLDQRVRRYAGAALVGVAVYGAIWFATSQQARFLIPVLPVLAVLAALGVRELARLGRAGYAAAALATMGSLAGGLAIFAAFCLQFFPVVFGLQSEQEFLAKRTAYYDGVAWLNRTLSGSDRVVTDFASPYLEPRYVVWTPLVLPPERGVAGARAYAREAGLRYAALLSGSEPGRRAELEALGARRVATVPVHTAFLGLRSWGGFPDRLLVYRLFARQPTDTTTSEPTAVRSTSPGGRGSGSPRSTSRKSAAAGRPSSFAVTSSRVQSRRSSGTASPARAAR